MTYFARAVAGAVVFAAATGAQAQSVAESYLDEFLQLYAAQGLVVEYGDKSASGDSIVLSDVTMLMGNDQAQSAIRLDSMSFTEIDDPVYDVEVRTSPDFAGEVAVDDGSGEMAMKVSGKIAGALRIGGPVGDRVMEMDYDSVSLSYDISQLDTEGGSGVLTITLSDIGGTLGYSLAQATQAYDMSIANASLSMDMDPAEEGEFSVQMTYTDMTLSGSAPIADMQNPSSLFTVDEKFAFRLDSGPYTSSIAAITPDGAFDLISNGETSFFGFEGGRGQLDYTFGGTGLTLIVTPKGLPMPPVEAQISETDMRFALPIAPTNGEGVAALRLNLDGVTVSDQLWAMVDGGGLIPRDPARILVDIEGAADVSANIMDPENAAALMGNPFTFKDASLKALEISFGGAEILGEGQADINNSGPIPMPVGGVDLRISGINGLLEKLGQIGLVPPEQSMPVRMMLGMFAKPTDDPDVFTTRIEAGADGSISANGIPLQ